MARTQFAPKSDVQILNPSMQLGEELLPPVQEHGNAVVADATSNKRQDAEAVAPKKRFFRVLNEKVVNDQGGFRTKLKEGKEIDNVNYDIRKLQQQGIRLQEVQPGNEPDETGFIE